LRASYAHEFTHTGVSNEILVASLPTDFVEICLVQLCHFSTWSTLCYVVPALYECLYS